MQHTENKNNDNIDQLTSLGRHEILFFRYVFSPRIDWKTCSVSVMRDRAQMDLILSHSERKKIRIIWSNFRRREVFFHPFVWGRSNLFLPVLVLPLPLVWELISVPATDSEQRTSGVNDWIHHLAHERASRCSVNIFLPPRHLCCCAPHTHTHTHTH